MTPSSRSVVVRNLANLVSVLGVLPICLLFVDGGYLREVLRRLSRDVFDGLPLRPVPARLSPLSDKVFYYHPVPTSCED